MSVMKRIWLSILLIPFFVTIQSTSLLSDEKQDLLSGSASGNFSLRGTRTAILIMDYQNEIINLLPKKDQSSLLERVNTLLKEARQAHIPIVYIVIRFREGYPEISARNKLLRGVKPLGWLREGTVGAEIHASIAPKTGDITISRSRVGAFYASELEVVLRAQNIDTLVLCGISTSGVVLSTVRFAADMDYQLVVISDACADLDEEVHRMLVEKVFPSQATVMTSQEFVKAIGTQR